MSIKSLELVIYPPFQMNKGKNVLEVICTLHT